MSKLSRLDVVQSIQVAINTVLSEQEGGHVRCISEDLGLFVDLQLQSMSVVYLIESLADTFVEVNLAKWFINMNRDALQRLTVRDLADHLCVELGVD